MESCEGMSSGRGNGLVEGMGRTGESSWFSGGDEENGNICSWKITSREERNFCVVRS